MTDNPATMAIATTLSVLGGFVVLAMYGVYGPVVAACTFFIPGPVTLAWAIATERRTHWGKFFPNGVYLLCGGMVSLAALFAFKATHRWHLA